MSAGAARSTVPKANSDVKMYFYSMDSFVGK